eukprot:scaffold23998_cov20-Tisochrysis_lutea.AAC.1
MATYRDVMLNQRYCTFVVLKAGKLDCKTDQKRDGKYDDVSSGPVSYGMILLLAHTHACYAVMQQASSQETDACVCVLTSLSYAPLHLRSQTSVILSQHMRDGLVDELGLIQATQQEMPQRQQLDEVTR